MTSVLCLLQQINQELTLGVSSQQIILEILPHCFELQSYFLLLILELVPGYWQLCRSASLALLDHLLEVGYLRRVEFVHLLKLVFEWSKAAIGEILAEVRGKAIAACRVNGPPSCCLRESVHGYEFG